MSRILSLAAAVLAVFALGLAAASPARADIEVNVNRGDVQPLPIAIPAFGGGQAGADITGVISADLQRSGLFRPLDPATFLEKDLSISVEPNFPLWRQVSAAALLQGATRVENGQLKVDFRLWDVAANKALLGTELSASPDNWRRIAHKIADAVYLQLTGEKGYFDTRVVFVAVSGARGAQTKRLAIMDQDGANPSYLDAGDGIVLTPRFSVNTQEITYAVLRPTGVQVYLLNLDTGRKESLGQFTGMVYAPRFSPDGRKVAFSAEKAGNSDIYVMDLQNHSTSRLTTEPAIDTSPSFSPDGRQIVFNSDRSGTPEIYVMGADGSSPHRISFGEGKYTTPVWSPTGEFIAFTKQTGGQFHIGVMRADGSEERLLTTSYLDEGPTWAPNGRVLMFSREAPGQGPRLFTVDVMGRFLQQAPYPGGGTDPAWSPLLN